MSDNSDGQNGVRLEDLSGEEFGRLFGKVFGKIKQDAGLSSNAPDEQLYEALRRASSVKERGSALERELAAERARLVESRAAASRLYGIVLERLPESVRRKAPAPDDAADPAALAQWAEVAASLLRESGPKAIDSVRNGGAPALSDAQTWLRLLADSQEARAFKRSHPDEWRRLVSRFGGKSLSEVKRMVPR